MTTIPEALLSKILDNPKERHLLAQLVHVVSAERLRPSCITCENFDEPAEICRLAGTRPPARVIVAGCPAFMENIPF